MKILGKVEIEKWVPKIRLDICKYSCNDADTVESILRRKEAIIESFSKHQDQLTDQADKTHHKYSLQNQSIISVSDDLVEYFTKFTDYIVNSKIERKDMAIVR